MTCFTMPLASASVDHFHSTQSVPGHPGGEARIQNKHGSIGEYLCALADRDQVRLSAFTHFDAQPHTLAVTHRGNSRHDDLVQRGVRSGVWAMRRRHPPRRGPRSHAATVRANFVGTAQEFKSCAGHRAVLILAGPADVYIVLGVLYETTSCA